MQVETNGLNLRAMGIYIVASAEGVEKIWTPAGEGLDKYIGADRWNDDSGRPHRDVVKFFDELFSNAKNFKSLSEVDAWANEYPDEQMQDAWNNFFSDWFDWFEEDVNIDDDEEVRVHYSQVLKYLKLYLQQHELVTTTTTH